MRSSSSLCFYDWDSAKLIRRIDISAKKIYWSVNGDLVTITSNNVFYVLKYNIEAVSNANLNEVGPDGIEEAFEVICKFFFFLFNNVLIFFF